MNVVHMIYSLTKVGVYVPLRRLEGYFLNAPLICAFANVLIKRMYTAVRKEVRAAAVDHLEHEDCLSSCQT